MIRILAFILLCVSVRAATWYVSPAGSDAAAGTTVGAPFLTIACAILTNAAAGDTVYLAPGVYKEVITLNRSGSAGSTIKVYGDPRNEKGFSGVTAQPVRWTGYTTDDKTDHANYALTLSTYDYYDWADIWFDGGDNGAVRSSNGSVYHTFTRCLFVAISGGTAVSISISTDTAANWTFSNCIFAGRTGIDVTPQATPTSAELDLEVSISNCLFMCRNTGVYVVDKAGTYPFCGVDIDSCTFFSAYGFAYTSTASNNGTIKNKIYRSLFNSDYGIQTSSTKTVVTEDWNYIPANTVRSAGESAGANTQTKYSLQINLGQYDLWFGRSYPPGAPVSVLSPIVGFDGSGAGYTTDFAGRSRPSGGATKWSSTNMTVGAFECVDVGAKETTLVDVSGASVKILGPGTQRIIIPVKAQSTTLTAKAAYDMAYGGTALPQVKLLAAPEIGVTTETLTVTTVTTNSFETLTFGAQTPSAAGAVTLEFISTCTNSTGSAYFDTVTRNY